MLNEAPRLHLDARPSEMPMPPESTDSTGGASGARLPDQLEPGAAVRVKRIYDPWSEADGVRILVDRLWPRGWAKARLGHDLWLPEVAPSPRLRDWFAHRPERYESFAHQYRVELTKNPALAQLLELTRRHGILTLLTGAREPDRSHVAVLQRVVAHLLAQLPSPAAR